MNSASSADFHDASAEIAVPQRLQDCGFDGRLLEQEPSEFSALQITFRLKLLR